MTALTMTVKTTDARLIDSHIVPNSTVEHRPRPRFTNRKHGDRSRT